MIKLTEVYEAAGLVKSEIDEFINLRLNEDGQLAGYIVPGPYPYKKVAYGGSADSQPDYQRLGIK